MNIQRFVNRSRSRQTVLTACLSALIAMEIMVVPDSLQAQQSVNQKPGQSNPVAVDVQIDKREALVAERVHLKITATAPQNVIVKFPELQEQLGDFEVMSVKDTLDIPAGSDRNWIRHVGLESLVSGELEIPSFEIKYVDRRGSAPVTGRQTTPPQQVNIRSTLEGVEDPTQFRDIKSVVFAPETPPRNNRWLVVASVAAGLVFVAALVFVKLRRTAELSPKQWAIKSLDELRESQAVKDKDTEQAYVRLVSILRTFVYWQFGISAPRLTTNEFLGAMQADDRLTEEFRSELSELLNLADMIKFAGMLPDGNQLTEVVDRTRKLVENASASEIQASKPGDVQLDSSTKIRQMQPTAEDK